MLFNFSKNDMMEHVTLFFIVTSIIFTGIFTLNQTADAQTNLVPDWVRNNALWWAEGKITEQEYLASIEFLISEGIIAIQSQSMPDPSEDLSFGEKILADRGEISELNFKIEPFAKNIPNDSDRAMLNIVTISGGHLEDSYTFDTFGSYKPGEDPIFLKFLRQHDFSSYFLLESLPNKSNAKFYEIVSKYYNPGKIPEPMDVKIETLSGDGSLIYTANYVKCSLSDYTSYLQDYIFVFQLTKKLDKEIRDRSIFSCQGFNVTVGSGEKFDLDGIQVIPLDEDRVTKFIVHFYNGDLTQVYSTAFRKFAPSVDAIDTPYVTITKPGNPIDGTPQFYLASLPSYDKRGFYELLSMYVNPVRLPEMFDVSIDMVTDDNTILQRWNYVDCEISSYEMHLEDSFLKFPFSELPSAEIRDKTDFTCHGNHLEVHGNHQIDTLPIRDFSYEESSSRVNMLYSKEFPTKSDRAMSYTVHVSDGELTDTISSENFPIFKAIEQNRGPLTPLHHAKQYDVGFYLESLPSKEKTGFYNFLAKYVNPGKDPEPIDVDVDVVTGDGRILETLQYRSCSAIDIDFYRQEMTFLFQITNEIQEEFRERFTFYCDGFTINVS